MLDEVAYRGALAAITIVYGLVRQTYARRASSRDNDVVLSSTLDRRSVVALNVFSIAGTAALLAYLIAPSVMRWSALALPPAVRWPGAAIGALAVAGFWWAHHALGRNWSGGVRITRQQEFIATGPYRLVRHPMYTAIAGVSLGSFLLSANWFIGATGLGTAAIFVARVGEEERLMMQHFGEAYDAYAQRAGRFLPARAGGAWRDRHGEG